MHCGTAVRSQHTEEVDARRTVPRKLDCRYHPT